MSTSRNNDGSSGGGVGTVTVAVVRWGILGTGAIATDMVQVLKQLPNTKVVGVGSRSKASADRFGSRWGIPNRHETYESLVSDPDVDVVYVATPSLRHPQDCRMAIEAGKAVLCEKSMAPNHDVAKEVLQLAKSSNKLLIHGVWSRFFPAMNRVRELIQSGAIGQVKSARASFCQDDGAGCCSALLETGIYCAQFLHWVLTARVEADGEGSEDASSSVEDDPIIVRGACRRNHDNGLDEHVSALLEFPGKKFGSFECSLSHCSDRSAAIYGTKGVIDIPFPFWCPTEIRITRMSGPGSQKWDGPDVETFSLPSGVNPLPVSTPAEDEQEGHVPGFTFVNSQGLAYEAEEVNRCVRESLLESPSFSSKACLDVMKIISDIDALSSADAP